MSRNSLLKVARRTARSSAQVQGLPAVAYVPDERRGRTGKRPVLVDKNSERGIYLYIKRAIDRGSRS